MALIESEPIEKFIKDGLNRKENPLGYDAIEILTEVSYAPEVDAVPVVRCKDCQRYYQYTDNLTGKQYNFGRCNKRYTSRNGEEAIVTDNDFCSQGVRKETAND